MTVPTETTVAVLVGSLRADSVNRRLAEAMRDRAPAGVRLDLVPGLGALPFYDQDLEIGATPGGVAALRRRVRTADAVLAVTPEYNATMPAVLNNAIDWLSRPYGAGAMLGKPFAVVGTAASSHGARWAHADTLRSARVAGAVPVEEATVSQSYAGIDVVADPGVKARLDEALRLLLVTVRAPAAA